MNDWQPIETAPKDGTKIDVWVVASKKWRPDGETLRYTDVHWESGAWHFYNEYLQGDCEVPSAPNYRITHWKPITEPPKSA